jgi:cytochrome oxidase Cu insertion factor (SCO1/SenC/PrrC family)
MVARSGSVGMMGPSRAERWSVAALGLILAISAVWFALALWPTGEAAPQWLVRAREVCFRSGANGLPDGGGWLALTGPPLSLLGVLAFGWWDDLRSGLHALARGGRGRMTLAAGALLVFAGIGAVSVRVAAASAWIAPGLPHVAARLDDQPARLDMPAPPLELIDQSGEVVSIERFRGRNVLLTFGFGHCETVCPTVVRDVREAKRRLAADGIESVMLVVTLDPWRDTPSRLRYLAEHWELDEGALVLSGAVETVERTLDAWKVSRARDLRTGEVIHTRLVYLLAPDGRVAFATSGSTDELVELARGI